MKNYYQILELPPNASPRRIKEQYRMLAKRYHPDRLSSPLERARLETKFKEINEAYEALSEIVKRVNLTPRERKLDFLYQQGQELCQKKEWSKALVVFNEILAIDPRYRDTVAQLREVRRKHKRLAALYVMADHAFQQQKWTEALATFEEIMHEDPTYRDVAKKHKKSRREQLMEGFMSQSL
jgi:tetratricopeptide (TPR) repeat protein